MKKLLVVAIVFLSGNCFAPAPKNKQTKVLLVLKQMTFERLCDQVPDHLCAKALKAQKMDIAEYIGIAFLGPNWRRAEAFVDHVNQLEKPFLAQQLEEELMPRVRELIMQRVAQDSREVAQGLREKVIAFIRANS